MKILVVDDDVYIQQLVAIHLNKEGYTVFTAHDAEQALMFLEDQLVDLAIVDVMMPGMDGFQLTRILTQDLDIPVILLTAKGQLEDKEKGFLSGTEDYMVKPFEPKELLFRVAVVLRRSERSVQENLQAGNLAINRRNFEVTIGKETLILPLKEFELLSLLVSRVNLATPRGLLMDYVWGEGHQASEMTLNTHINRIRDRLKLYGADVEIHTLRGIGYKLESPK